VVSSCFHYPAFYPQTHSRLVERFNTIEDFGNLTSNQLRTLCKALFIRPNSASELPVSASSFQQESLAGLHNTVISRRNKGLIRVSIGDVLHIMEAFHKLANPSTLSSVDWVLLDPEEELHMDSIGQDA